MEIQSKSFPVPGQDLETNSKVVGTLHSLFHPKESLRAVKSATLSTSHTTSDVVGMLLNLKCLITCFHRPERHRGGSHDSGLMPVICQIKSHKVILVSYFPVLP